METAFPLHCGVLKVFTCVVRIMDADDVHAGRVISTCVSCIIWVVQGVTFFSGIVVKMRRKNVTKKAMSGSRVSHGALRYVVRNLHKIHSGEFVRVGNSIDRVTR